MLPALCLIWTKLDMMLITCLWYFTKFNIVVLFGNSSLLLGPIMLSGLKFKKILSEIAEQIGLWYDKYENHDRNHKLLSTERYWNADFYVYLKYKMVTITWKYNIESTIMIKPKLYLNDFGCCKACSWVLYFCLPHN